MSGEGPESIPTSADPRSRRPVKKRALTPTTAQAASVDALFAKPDQEIRVPLSAAEIHERRKRAAASSAPEIVTNVQGSSAGAGSGEFHVYKAARRREYERLRVMDQELRSEKEAESFDKAKSERDARDEEKTRKNREKREKKNRNKNNKGKKDPPNRGAPVAGVARREPVSGDRGEVAAESGEGGASARDTNAAAAGWAGETGSKAPSTAQPAGLVIQDDDE